MLSLLVSEAREALVACLMRGQPWRLKEEITRRLERLRLNQQLIALGERPTSLSHLSPPTVQLSCSVEDWLLQRLEELGFEESSDLELLSREDLLPPELDEGTLGYLDKVFPQRLNLNDAQYLFHYEAEKRRVIMEQISGSRREPPRVEWLPQCGGFEIRFKRGQHDSALRARRHARH